MVKSTMLDSACVVSTKRIRKRLRERAEQQRCCFNARKFGPLIQMRSTVPPGVATRAFSATTRVTASAVSFSFDVDDA